MKILVVCHYGLYQDLTASFVHNQAKEYAALGHRVRVIIPNGIGKNGPGRGRVFPLLSERETDGVELVDLRYVTLSRFGEKHFNTSSAVAAIRVHWNRIFDDFRPDVIHAHTLGFDSEIGAWLKKKLHCPLVVTTHGSDTVLPLEKGQQALLKRWCDQADAVVAVSRCLKQRLAVCGTKTRLYSIYNGFVPRPIPAGNERNAYSMIQVGHLIPSKRVDETIRALALLRKDYPDMTLTVVGQGPLREELERLCVPLGVKDAVCFSGQLPNDQVFALLCRSRFFVMASKPEGFGIVYLEAMAAGCVTIGTEGEGIADVIEHGVNGFLVPADDPDAIAAVIADCIQNPEKAAQIADRGKQTALKLTWRENARNYIDLFGRALSC